MEEFHSKAGISEKAHGKLYTVFTPNKLPIKIDLSMQLIKLLDGATNALGELSGAGLYLSNPHILIAPYLRKEAVLSSKIEGTKTTLDELFLSEKAKSKPIGPDAEEVTNYVKALNFGLEHIKTQPISQELIKKLHEILMQGVRGQDKDPGQYKQQQNWIGPSYDIMEARFVPPPPQNVEELMHNLVSFLEDDEEKIPELLKIGLSHYQFEAIHPFRDGNGRLGRLLVILYLCRTKKLSQPLLYLSAFFSKHKDTYIDSLFRASRYGEIENWLYFFLRAVQEQARDAIIRTHKLTSYNQECQRLLREKTSSTNVLALLEQLFSNPYITIPEAQEIINASSYTAAKYDIDLLVEHGILEQVPPEIQKNLSRAKMYKATRILEILDLQVPEEDLQNDRQTSIQSFS